MSAPKQSERFAEIEFCLQNYFRTHLLSVMQKTKTELQEKQVREIGEYNTSFTGIMRSLAGNMNNQPDDTLLYLRQTGEWNSKTAEDYVEMCKQHIVSSKTIQNDLVCLTDEWRNTLVQEIGRVEYDRLSQEMGEDLALAYTNYRMEQLMIDRMVADEMPKSSLEYIIRKGAEGSLLGLGTSLTKSPLQQEIDERGEAVYQPTDAEKGAGKAVSFGTDVITTGGVASWGALVSLAGTEIAFSGLEKLIDKPTGSNAITVEQCISRGVFKQQENVFDGFRKQSMEMKSYEHPYILKVNDELNHKMSILTEKPLWAEMIDRQNGTDKSSKISHFGMQELNEKTPDSSASLRDPRYTDVPIVVAPGKEEEYLASLERQKQEGKNGTVPEDNEAMECLKRESQVSQSSEATQERPTYEKGWNELLATFGLNGLERIGTNFGYVISMLPDILTGVFTGKTQSIGLKSSLLPIASILIGMFIKNPMLKLLLIGMGGANLMNKVGQEAIARQNKELSPQTPRFRRYADEPLNPRICQPALQGNLLITTIDHVPCSIHLPNNVIAACQSGALPLNTLANAVLAKNDEMQRTAQDNYRNVENARSEGREHQVILK